MCCVKQTPALQYLQNVELNLDEFSKSAFVTQCCRLCDKLPDKQFDWLFFQLNQVINDLKWSGFPLSVTQQPVIWFGDFISLPNTHRCVHVCVSLSEHVHKCVMCVCVVGMEGWSLTLRDNGGLSEWNDGGMESREEEWDGTEWTGRCNPPSQQ